MRSRMLCSARARAVRIAALATIVVVATSVVASASGPSDAGQVDRSVFTVDPGASSATSFGDRDLTTMSVSVQDRTIYVWGSDTYPNGAVRSSTNLSLAAPTGRALQPGTTYPTRRYADDAHAGLDLGSGGSACSPTGGELTVHEMETAPDGTPTRLAASYRIDCSAGSTFGEVRWHSAVPYVKVQLAPAGPSVLTVDDPATATLTYANTGSLPVRTGKVTVSETADAERVVLQDTCSGTELAPGSDCTVSVEITLREMSTSDHQLLITVPDDSPPRSHRHAFVVPVRGVSPPADLAAAGLIGRNVISWSPSPGRAAAGYRVYRSQRSWSQDTFLGQVDAETLGVARPASVLPFLASTVAAPNVPTPAASEPLYHLALPLLAATGWACLRLTTAAEATWPTGPGELAALWPASTGRCRVRPGGFPVLSLVTPHRKPQ